MTGKLVSTEVGAQAEQMFANLSAILEAAGSSLDRVLTANIYLTDSTNYAAFNEVYTRVGTSRASAVGGTTRLMDTVDARSETAEDMCLCQGIARWSFV